MSFDPLIFEDPQFQIEQDWDNGHYQWREITGRAYRAFAALPHLHADPEGFMMAAPIKTLLNGEGLQLCCKQSKGHYFAQLVPRFDWDELRYYPLPPVKTSLR